MYDTSLQVKHFELYWQVFNTYYPERETIHIFVTHILLRDGLFWVGKEPFSLLFPRNLNKGSDISVHLVCESWIWAYDGENKYILTSE